MDPVRERFHDSASEPDWDDQEKLMAREEFARDPIMAAVGSVRYLVREYDSLPRRSRVERELVEKNHVSESDAETAVRHALADGFLSSASARDRGQRAQILIPGEHDHLAEEGGL